jgi:hypothetical protein
MPERKWDQQKVVDAILQIRRSGGKLNSDHIRETNMPLYGAALKYWRGWRQAIEAAGLTWEEIRAVRANYGSWSKEIIAQTILSRYEAEEPLNSNHIQTEEYRLYGAACKYFGSWAQAIAAAGLDYDELRRVPPKRSWTKEAIVAEVQRRAKAGLSIRGGDVYFEDEGLYQAAKRYYGKGSWAKVRVLAGFTPIDPKPFKVWDREPVIEEIKRLHENEVPLHVAYLQKSEYRYILSAGAKYFGSWEKAVRAAGFNYEEIRQVHYWTNEEILEGIQSLERQGVRLSSKAIQTTYTSLFSIAVTRFGCWSQAVEAAGIDYRRHCRTWSTKAWLRRMTDVEYKEKLS